MYLPKSKYTIKHAKPGEFTLSGSSEEKYYVGPYIEDYLGRTFAGTDITKAEERVLVSCTNKEITEVQEIKNDLVPNEELYLTGSYTRYFRQSKATKAIEEISEEQIEDSGTYWYVSGTWIISGSLKDRWIFGYPYRGVYYRNAVVLQEWEKEIPGIATALEISPSQFVRES